MVLVLWVQTFVRKCSDAVVIAGGDYNASVFEATVFVLVLNI